MMKANKIDSREKTVIFIHIPKAGGTTLNKIIQRQYKDNAVFNIYGDRPQESINKFKELTEAERQKFGLLSGHMPFGLHKLLPNSYTYVTMLRNPVERIISHYYYVLREPKHYLHTKVASRGMSLRDYVCSGITTELDNGQTRLISGVDSKSVSYGNCSVEILEDAKKNLRENFAVVGLTERFDESLILMKKALGWNKLFYSKKNVTKSRPLKENISQEIIETIEQQNSLDIELYQYAKESFDFAVRQQSIGFQRNLKFLKLINNIYENHHSLKTNMRRKILNSR